MTAPKLRAVPPIVLDANAEVMRALALALAPYLLPILREELVRGAGGDALVDVLEHVHAPKRTVMRACRTGAIDGATKIGRRWLAPKVSVDAWAQKLGPRVVKSDGAGDGAFDDLRERIARGAR